MGTTGGHVFEPKVITMPLPHSREWLWYADLNIVALAPHLDDAGRERCLDELQAEWRAAARRHLASVPKPPPEASPPPPGRTVPAVVLVPVYDLPASAV